MNAPHRASDHTSIAVTMGEPAGIGGEIVLKAWVGRRSASAAFFAIDDPERLRLIAAKFSIPCPIAPITVAADAKSLFPSALPVLPLTVPIGESTLGRLRTDSGKAVIAAIDQAIALVQRGEAAAMVTNPIQKASLQGTGFAFPGHTEYLGHLAGATPAMMLAIEGLRVVPVTVHLPVRDVATSLTTRAIVEHGRITDAALRRDFGVANPRLAVAALNPHAGESGKMGDEEIRIIAPAVAQLNALGITAAGPSPADTLFHPAARERYDAVLCMYHDQALIPLKTLDFAGGVNITLGLPFVRCSPDHGTALDIAAQGVADPTSLIAAIRMADEMARRRANARA